MDLILLIGLPASGKSTFSRRAEFASYTRICGDEISQPNLKKLLRRAQIALENGESVLLDGTHLEKSRREPFLALAEKYGARKLGFYFESRLAPCLERNAAREGKARVPDVALFSAARRLEFPRLAEGFDTLFYVKIEGAGFSISPWNEETNQ